MERAVQLRFDLDGVTHNQQSEQQPQTETNESASGSYEQFYSRLMSRFIQEV